MLAVGIFAKRDQLENFSQYSGMKLVCGTQSSIEMLYHSNPGLFHGGGFYLLGVQLLASLCCIVWSMTVTFILIKVFIH